MSEAANHVFQWMFVQNSVKYKFFPVCIVNINQTLFNSRMKHLYHKLEIKLNGKKFYQTDPVR